MYDSALIGQNENVCLIRRQLLCVYCARSCYIFQHDLSTRSIKNEQLIYLGRRWNYNRYSTIKWIWLHGNNIIWQLIRAQEEIHIVNFCTNLVDYPIAWIDERKVIDRPDIRN